MNYRLIPMERAHLPQAAELERQCFSDPWTEAQLAGELDNELLSLSAAVGEDGTVLGYAEVRVLLDEGTLARIAVAPRYRRQGIAEALLDAYIPYGRELLAFLTLEVRAGNAPAIALYEKLGFEKEGLLRMTTVRTGRYVDEYKMARIRPGVPAPRPTPSAPPGRKTPRRSPHCGGCPAYLNRRPPSPPTAPAVWRSFSASRDRAGMFCWPYRRTIPCSAWSC